jgi:aspartate/methionine/tyrosine aminotransferase
VYSSLLASVEVMGFHATEAYSNLGLTNVQYSIRRLCREEKEKFTVLINPNNPIACEKM